jgi:hypothetical protein
MGRVRKQVEVVSDKEKQLQYAIAVMQSGKYTSICKCAKAYDVPSSTLHDRVHGERQIHSVAHQDQQLLLPSQEMLIVK